MTYTLRFEPSGTVYQAEGGENLLEAARSAGLAIDAPCGGQGTCEKCVVFIVEESGAERVVLACQTTVGSDMVVRVADDHETEILVEGVRRQVALGPAVRALQVDVERVGLGDARSDWERLVSAVAHEAGIEESCIDARPFLVDGLRSKLEACDYRPSVVLYENGIVDVRTEHRPIYVVAFDIGTTTMVCYLLSVDTGEELAHASMLNPQTRYGADVISRASFAIENGVDEISSCVRTGMSELLQEACAQAGVATSDVYLATVVGNTCMHHLFAHILPEALVVAPYSPAVRELLCMNAAHCGLSLNPCGVVELLPVIAGFVGADSAACMLSAQFDQVSELSVLIDIGTNGEIMMTDGARTIACSTAAGPALEGAKIEQGMRGAEGAIDHVWMEDGKLCYSVIGDVAPIGICGSGLIDAAAVLFENGVVMKTGRMLVGSKLDAAVEEGRVPQDLARRVQRDEEGKRFVLAEAGDSGIDGPVYVSQQDVGELQLAKGAIAVGVELLAEELGYAVEDIRHVLVAGAFGNYMSAHGACAIGLIDPVLEERIEPIGNAAGEGARLVALSRAERERCKRMSAATEFLELAVHPEFQERFAHALNFPVKSADA